jgi:hypothetical protein
VLAALCVATWLAQPGLKVGVAAPLVVQQTGGGARDADSEQALIRLYEGMKRFMLEGIEALHMLSLIPVMVTVASGPAPSSSTNASARPMTAADMSPTKIFLVMTNLPLQAFRFVPHASLVREAREAELIIGKIRRRLPPFAFARSVSLST